MCPKERGYEKSRERKKGSCWGFFCGDQDIILGEVKNCGENKLEFIIYTLLCPFLRALGGIPWSIFYFKSNYLLIGELVPKCDRVKL